MKVVTEILQDLEILKRLLKHNANLKIRINYYLTYALLSGGLIDSLSNRVVNIDRLSNGAIGIDHMSPLSVVSQMGSSL